MKPRPSNAWWATTSHDELHHRQDALLRRFLKDRVVPFTAHYGKLFQELGIQAGDIRGTHEPRTGVASLVHAQSDVMTTARAAAHLANAHTADWMRQAIEAAHGGVEIVASQRTDAEEPVVGPESEDAGGRHP